MALLLVSMGAGIHRACRREPLPDWDLFHAAGRLWLERGDPAGLAWYPPFAVRVIGLFARLEPELAGLAWVAFNALTLVAAVVLLTRRWGGAARTSGLEGVAQHVAEHAAPVLFLLAPAVLINFWVNQLVAPVLLLVVASALLLEQRRDALAGVSLGLATLLKVSPGLLILWLLLRRRRRAALAALATLVVAGPGLDALEVGLEPALGFQLGWLTRVRYSGSAWSVLVESAQADAMNHAPVAVIRRLFQAWAPFYGAPWQEALLVELPVAALWALFGVGLAALAACVTAPRWFRRVARGLPPLEPRTLGRREFALWLIAVLLITPVLRHYHHLLLYPALALLVAEVRRDPDSVAGRLSLGALAIWLSTAVLSWHESSQAFGAPLFGLAAIALALGPGLEAARATAQRSSTRAWWARWSATKVAMK